MHINTKNTCDHLCLIVWFQELKTRTYMWQGRRNWSWYLGRCSRKEWNAKRLDNQGSLHQRDHNKSNKVQNISSFSCIFFYKKLRWVWVSIFIKKGLKVQKILTQMLYKLFINKVLTNSNSRLRYEFNSYWLNLHLWTLTHWGFLNIYAKNNLPRAAHG